MNCLTLLTAQAAPLIYNAIKIVETLPEVGDEQSFYKVSSDQKVYYWNGNENKFVCLNFEMPEALNTLRFPSLLILIPIM